MCIIIKNKKEYFLFRYIVATFSDINIPRMSVRISVYLLFSYGFGLKFKQIY